MADYIRLPFVEIEIRFGTLSKTFDSNVDKKYFNQIMESLLENKNVFKNIEKKTTIEHINKNLKLIKDSKNVSIIMKEKILNKSITLSFSPFDIKLSISQEFSLNSYVPSFKIQDTLTRKKDRTSFINPDYRYDLTIVNETANNVNKQKYEIEIELLINKNTLTWSNEYINEFIECKIYDIVKIVENVDRDKFKLDLF